MNKDIETKLQQLKNRENELVLYFERVNNQKESLSFESGTEIQKKLNEIEEELNEIESEIVFIHETRKVILQIAEEPKKEVVEERNFEEVINIIENKFKEFGMNLSKQDDGSVIYYHSFDNRKSNYIEFYIRISDAILSVTIHVGNQRSSENFGIIYKYQNINFERIQQMYNNIHQIEELMIPLFDGSKI